MSEDHDEEFEDGLAILRANIDQALATIPIIAPLAWAWFESFQQEGFNEEQALKLTASQMSRASEE